MKASYDPSMYLANIRSVYAQATMSDLAEGTRWYTEAGHYATRIAASTGRSVETVAGVLAALSPRNKWCQNMLDAEAYCWAASEDFPMPKACTFGANQRKAWAIARLNDPSILSGRKVTSFIANICGDWTKVTVDVWAIRAATNFAEDAVKNDAQYAAIEQAYRVVAAEVGQLPAILQAICWVIVKGMPYARKSRS